MKKFKILFWLIMVAHYLAQEQKSSDLTSSSRPNIVFIMSDDHAVSAISAYKDWLSELAPTPNIYRIAENGMLMTRTFNTNSICGPSRASILTGKYSHVNGFFKNEKGGDFDGLSLIHI